MAENLLSKVNLSGVEYLLKDAAARATIATYGDVVTHSMASTINDGDGKIADASVVKAYVDAQTAAIHKFDVVVVDTLPEASASTMYKIYLVPDTSAATGNVYKEYITIRSGEEGSYTYAWEQIGTTETDLTNYVKKTQTVAGIALQSDISVAAMSSALSLGALANKDNASETVSDYATGVSINDITAAGSVSVVMKYDATSADVSFGAYTPAGTVDGGKVVAAGSVSMEADNAGAQIGGTNADSNVTIVPKTASVLSAVSSSGALPSFVEGAFTAATLSHAEAAFAVEGLVASVSSADECLVLAAASTSNASLISGFSGGSKVADTWDAGSLTTFSNLSVMTGISSATAAAQIFTGNKYKFTFAGSTVDVTGASFSGSAASLSGSISYDKADVSSASFSGSAVSASGSLVTGSKTITVS